MSVKFETANHRAVRVPAADGRPSMKFIAGQLTVDDEDAQTVRDFARANPELRIRELPPVAPPPVLPADPTRLTRKELVRLAGRAGASITPTATKREIIAALEARLR